MENITKYIIQQTILYNMNNNQITFFNSIISEFDKTHNKEEKEINLHQYSGTPGPAGGKFFPRSCICFGNFFRGLEWGVGVV